MHYDEKRQRSLHEDFRIIVMLPVMYVDMKPYISIERKVSSHPIYVHKPTK